MRLSAAYKGLNALLMAEGSKDFMSGKPFDQIVFFDDDVDIHHIFPQEWCKNNSIAPSIYDSVINKTPLAARTNRVIGGVAPSEYLAKLESGSETYPAIPATELDSFLETHFIDPQLLRTDDFEKFMVMRQASLVALIEKAIGRGAIGDEVVVGNEWASEQGEPENLILN
jgi:hypothetical protein